MPVLGLTRQPSAQGRSCEAEGEGPHHHRRSTRPALLPRKKAAEQSWVFFFLHFIISNPVDNSIKREKSKEVFKAAGPDLGEGRGGPRRQRGSSVSRGLQGG